MFGAGLIALGMVHTDEQTPQQEWPKAMKTARRLEAELTTENNVV